MLNIQHVVRNSRPDKRPDCKVAGSQCSAIGQEVIEELDRAFAGASGVSRWA